jgi:hypothetical protein
MGFLVVWLLGWTLGGAAALTVFLWMLAGKQILRIDRGVLSVRWDVFGRGYSREYTISSISNLRVGAGGDSSLFNMGRAGDVWGFTGGPLVFDYGAQTIRVAVGLHEAEAKTLLPRIARYLPRASAG